MNPTFAIDYCRIVSPERLSDRFLASGVLSAPESTQISDQVFLAYVFEVSKPWFPSSKVFPTILGTLHAGHPDLRAGKNLGDQFEELLKAVNQQLNLISEQGETDWIGNLNGLILVMGGDELHFSQTGHCPAYLLQKNRIRQITDDTPPEKELHPLKTFSNLASGSLQPDDYLLVSNRELYNEISLDALRRILNNNTPASSCTSIVKELKKERNLAVSSIILKVTTPEALAEKKVPEVTEIILEDEMQSNWKKLQKRLTPWVQKTRDSSVKIGKAGLVTAQKTSVAVKETVTPIASDLLKKGAQGAAQIKGKIEERQRNKAVAPAAVVEIILPTSKQQEAVEMGVEAAPIETEAPSVEPPATPESVTPEVSPIKVSPVTRFRDWLNQPRNRKLSALALAAILLAVTVSTLLSRRAGHGSTSSDNQVEQQITQADEQRKKAATAHDLKQDIEASREITTGEQILNKLSNLTDAQKKQVDTIWDGLLAEADTLTTTTRFSSPVATYNFSNPSEKVVSNLPYFYGFASNAPALMRTGKGDQTVTQTNITLSDSTDSIVAITDSNEADTAGYILTKKNKIFRLIQSDSATTMQSLAPANGEFAPGDALGTFNGNLYILDGKTGLVWKYAFTGTSYNKGVSVIDSTKFDLKKSVSLAIDGSIYILKQDGTVKKFTSGAADDFTYSNIPTLAKDLIQPLQIITNESTQDVYVLDAGTSSGDRSNARILEFTKTGSYVRQYAFPKDYTKVKGFDVDAKAKKLWVLNGATVGEFDL